jgi:hypothetical protein
VKETRTQFACPTRGKRRRTLNSVMKKLKRLLREAQFTSRNSGGALALLSISVLLFSATAANAACGLTGTGSKSSIRLPMLAQAGNDQPMHHRDPFDHLLIARAIAEEAIFLSKTRTRSNSRSRLSVVQVRHRQARKNDGSSLSSHTRPSGFSWKCALRLTTSSFLDGLQQMSNCHCLPGRAG